MKKSIRILVLLLSFVFLFSSVACNKKPSESYTPDPGSGDPIITPSNPDTGTITVTDGYLVKDGKSDYKLVIPADASNKEELAASEFNDIFKQSTGFTLPIVKDDAVNYKKGDKYIFLGLTNVLSDFGVNPLRSEIGEQGYILKTCDYSVVLTGATKKGYGTLYAVYEYLHYQLGFECYAEDETFVNQYVDCKLLDVNVKDKPDVANAALSGGAYSSNMQFQYRNRFISLTNDLFVGRTTPYHSSFFYLPKEQYLSKHPKWYSPNGDQICYTARGDKDEYNALVDELFKIYVDVVKENEDVQHLSFNIEDTVTFCTCSECQAAKKKYGANSATCIMLLNRISEKFEEARKTDAALADRTLDFHFFAYKETFEAPAKYDSAQGKYVPAAPEVVCRDDVYPFVCTFNMNRAESFTSPKNVTGLKTIEAWGSLAKSIAFWTYTENYNDYLAPRDCITPMQENYKLIASLNPIFFKEESQGVNYNGTGFMCMKYWLQYKLCWDVNRDVDALIDEYFDHYFQDAKEPMRKYYDSYTMTLRKLAEEKNYSQYDNLNILSKDKFSYGLLNGWLGYIDEAYKAIEYLKDEDEALYNKLKKRIAIESVTVNYSLISLYGNNFSTEALREKVTAFKADSELANITYWDDNHKRLVQDFIDANMG